jgi:hypothetical protein
MTKYIRPHKWRTYGIKFHGFSNNGSKKKARLAPWMEEGTQNLLAQIGSHGVLWILSTTNLFPLSGGNN